MEHEDSSIGMLGTWPFTCHHDAITDTKQYQGLGMERSAAPIVCACVFGRDCTLKREGTILATAEKYNRAVAQVRGANPDSWEVVPQYVSTDKNAQNHACACDKSFASVYALKDHVAKGWVGSSHDRSPKCRSQLAIAYLISDASHPNPYQSVLAAHTMRVVRAHRASSKATIQFLTK